MKPITPPPLKPGSAIPDAHADIAVWTALGALAATVMLGIAAPRFVGHAQAGTPASAAPRPIAAPQTPATARPVPFGRGDASVPRADDVFAKPASAAAPIEAQAPTF